MSLFGGGNNNSGGSAFGGFGSSNTGFGVNNNTTSAGSLFGGNTATTGGFGGFGTNTTQNNPFAPKPTFGSTTTTTGGSLFGSSTNTTGGFGGGTSTFGNTTNNNTGFGNTAGGGLFGANKPATGGFGSTNTGGSLFGTSSTGTAFGANAGTTSTNPFGTNASTGFGSTATNAGGFGFGGGSAIAGNNNNGTQAVPFQAFQEKEQSGTSHYQSITFQDPYKAKSFEELRLEDYAQGRRYGNTNGQAGSFGQNTPFGGFGQTNTNSGGSLFGSQPNTANASTSFGGFGANSNNTTTTGFGSTSGSSLFGQNKPATGGLFGSTTTSSAPASNPFGGTSGGGGLFGASTGGFGSNTNTTNTGGGLFGSNTNQQQSAPFGQSTTTTGGGLFGQQNKPATGGLFGSTTTNTGGGLFGGTNQQQQQGTNPFGASTSTGGGLFGSAQQTQNKPFGGFGQSTNTGGFGNNASTGGGLFGSTNTQANTGGLFGSNQNKPAGGSLFGNTTTTQGGVLFGANNQQQNTTGGSLFGNTNAGSSLFGNNQNKTGGGLFGSTANTNTGGSLFGNTQQNNTGSLFGNTNQNQSNQGGSLFGSTNQTQQAQNQLHASLTDTPYGNPQLFSIASLTAASPPIGPLATPLNGAKPTPRKTPSLMASMRLNSPAYTPRGSVGRAGGYGFSYSTYGTPGSAFSGSLTPGASSMLRPTGSFGSTLGSRLNKSMSLGNLRGDGTPSEGRSLLREGALSPPGSTVGRYGNGSVRKLNIDRSLRTDLFGPRNVEPEQSASARKVNFNGTAETPEEIPRDRQPNIETTLVSTDTDETPEREEPPALLKAPPHPNGPSRQPEMRQVNGSNGALTTVPEEGSVQRPGSAPATQSKPVPKIGPPREEVGDYWTKPSLQDLKNMSRQQLQKIGKFIVGRYGVGRIEFGPCDLSTTPLDDICGDIVRLNPRSATVYQDDSDKPAMGKALNVPSIIYLENSWPRSQGGKKSVQATEGREYDKHIARLKRVSGTKFMNYDPKTGVWQFSVEHFTTYGLDDDDDESYEEGQTEPVDTSGLSDAPTTPGTQRHEELDDTIQSMDMGTGEMDDTFQFKLQKRSQMTLPGGFDDEQGVSYDYDDPSADEDLDADADAEDPFHSSDGAVQPPSPDAVKRYHESVMEEDSKLVTDKEAAEDNIATEIPGAFEPQPRMLRSILKPSNTAFASPEKLATETWEDQLQRTISPRKRDRATLKEMQQGLMKAISDRPGEGMDSPFKQSLIGRSTLGDSYLAQKSAKKAKTGTVQDSKLGKSQAFRTSMDIMKSLWAEEKTGKKSSAGARGGFEYPYAKRPRLSTTHDLTESDAAFHANFKPSFAAEGTLVYSAAGSAPAVSGTLIESHRAIVGEHRDIRFAKFAPPEDLMNGRARTVIDTHMKHTEMLRTNGTTMPMARTSEELTFADMAKATSIGTSAAEKQELAIWEASSVLFDRLDIACGAFINEIPEDQRHYFAKQLRHDAFVAMWSKLVATDVDRQLRSTSIAEKKALILLTKNDVSGACETLVAAKDFRLASLVAQLPGSEASRNVMRKQIEAWQSRKDWSEMGDAVRALYCVLAGEVCRVPGLAGAPEDRASDFCIAEEFGLTWKQSLALRVLYGGYESLEAAISGYCEDVAAKKESVVPSSFWARPGQNDGARQREDTLMLLCRIFASGKESGLLSELCDPHSISGQSTNSRIAWQLSDILQAKQIASLPAEKADVLTMAFASELEAANLIPAAAWISLHLDDNLSRIRAINDLLHRNAASIGDFEGVLGDENFTRLTGEIQIPRPLIFAAKATHAKACGDIWAQVRYLLDAADSQQAHSILLNELGPKAVIEQDYAELAILLNHFSHSRPTGWHHGGQVYDALVRLVALRPGQRSTHEGEKYVRVLRKGLAEMEQDGAAARTRTLEQKVAIIEMRRLVEEVEREQGNRSGGPWAKDGVVERKDMGAMLDAYREAMGSVV